MGNTTGSRTVQVNQTHVKNTFIQVHIPDIEKDPRKIRSWGSGDNKLYIPTIPLEEQALPAMAVSGALDNSEVHEDDGNLPTDVPHVSQPFFLRTFDPFEDLEESPATGSGSAAVDDASLHPLCMSRPITPEPSPRNRHTSDAAEDKSMWTCRMLKNIPNDYKRQDLLALLDANGISYDFIYLPIDWKIVPWANVGYAFVNLISTDEAERVEVLLEGFSDWRLSTEEVCEVAWAMPNQQSLHENIERFRNSPVMHPDVDDEFRPVLFESGRRIVFPGPTKRLSRPRGYQKFRTLGN